MERSIVVVRLSKSFNEISKEDYDHIRKELKDSLKDYCVVTIVGENETNTTEFEIIR